MNKNPIRKMHVGWKNHWLGDTRTASPVSVREWVAVCPKCNVVSRTKPYGVHYNTKNTRKSAKDALHHHMRTFH